MGIDVESLRPVEEGGAEPRARNAEMARIFDEIADILEIKGEQHYRVNAYRTASRSVSSLKDRLETVFAEGRLREIHGVGPALEAKIVEFLSTGRLGFYEGLKRDFPSGLATLLGVPGLGPTRARAVYQGLKISSIADLERAAREGRLLAVPGFGEKMVESLLESLARMKERTTRHLISTGWESAQGVTGLLEQRANPRRIATVGSVRRMLDTIGNVDLVAIGERDALFDALEDLPNAVQRLRRDERHVSVLLYGGLEVRIHLVAESAWGAGLVWFTGSGGHLKRLVDMARERDWELSERGLFDATGKLLAGADEEGVYERLGLQWIPPELREDSGEIEAAKEGRTPTLVRLEDLRGDLHVHSNWTDGAYPLEDMAEAAKARGFEYMALTDHSRSLTVARGLTPERLLEQRRLVDRVNRKLAPFTVLLGTEMDILRDGSLDFPDEVLATLDYVSASVHSAFKQPREEMTARIVRAVSNPFVNVLNHPFGRIIRRREPYAVDMAAVVQAAIRAGCALELNAQPDRLDLEGSWARRAREAGARFTISTDAHSKENYNFMRYGIGSARRGWLTAEDVLNTRPLEELKRLLRARRNGQS